MDALTFYPQLFRALKESLTNLTLGPPSTVPKTPYIVMSLDVSSSFEQGQTITDSDETVSIKFLVKHHINANNDEAALLAMEQLNARVEEFRAALAAQPLGHAVEISVPEAQTGVWTEDSMATAGSLFTVTIRSYE